MAENKGQHQGNQGQGRGGNQGSNLTQQDRERGGRRSASEQTRDNQGQFAGKAGTTAGGNRNQGQPGRNAGNTNQTPEPGSTATSRTQADRDMERSEGGHYENQSDIEDVDRGGAEWNAEGSEEEHLRRERGMRTPQQED